MEESRQAEERTRAALAALMAAQRGRGEDEQLLHMSVNQLAHTLVHSELPRSGPEHTRERVSVQ